MKIKLLKTVLSWFATKEHNAGSYALVLLEDTNTVQHYRWVQLENLYQYLRKAKIGGVLVPLSQVSHIQRCPVANCDYNLLKIRLKTGGSCSIKVKVTLGNLLKNSRQVFTDDSDVNWYDIRLVKFIPVGQKFYHDHHGYELLNEDNDLVVRRFYPHTNGN